MNEKLEPHQLESLADAEVSIRNAMVLCATTPLYPDLAKMQRKLLKLVRAEQAKAKESHP